MNKNKHDLMSDEETAQILGIRLRKLYRICSIFDSRDDDQWDLIEGEHFEWLSKNLQTRRFYEEGAVAIARYIQEIETAGLFASLVDAVVERITKRRKRIRKMLVRRRVILEVSSFKDIISRNDLVFIARPKVIRILATNGKGLNAAARREQNNPGLKGREPMEQGVHFDTIENVEYWSQRGLVHIAQNMSENLSQKSRKAWTEAVAEVYEDAIEQQKKYLDSFNARVQKAMDQVKAAANHRCQVTLQKREPHDPFDLHVHHLFDRSTRPDLAAFHDNLLVMHENLHENFHKWHGSASCEPTHFIDYLTTVECWRFETPARSLHLHKLINRLEKLQGDFKNHHYID